MASMSKLFLIIIDFRIWKYNYGGFSFLKKEKNQLVYYNLFFIISVLFNSCIAHKISERATNKITGVKRAEWGALRSQTVHRKQLQKYHSSHLPLSGAESI